MLNRRLVLNQNRINSRNDALVKAEVYNHGFALLMMLSLILIAFTTVAILHLSANSNQLKQKTASLKAMTQARNAIIGYSLIQQSPSKPPGTLPCPDTDHDGKENAATVGCVSRIGLVPFKDLNLPELFDGTGAPLWYAVATGYAGPPSALPLQTRNSSLASALKIDNGATLAFIIIAPGAPIGSQRPTLTPLAAVTEFLEGDNSNGTLDSYSAIQDSTHNDQLLGVTTADFWPNVEKVVLENVKALLASYYTSCKVYPWAATFISNSDNSASTATYEGLLPLGTAQPTNWNTTCPAPNAAFKTPPMPSWLSGNWSKMLYYATCTPPTTLCLSLFDASAVITKATTIVIAPGVSLGAQTRPAAPVITNLFEGRDASPGDQQFDNIKPTANDNDTLTIVAP